MLLFLFIILVELSIPLNKFEKEKKVIELQKEGKTREIPKIVKMSEMNPKNKSI